MGNIWKFLNAPLVVVLIALATWPIFLAISGGYAIKIGFSQIVGEVKKDIFNPMGASTSDHKENLSKKLKYQELVEIKNIGFGISTWEHQQKIIATLKNGSPKAINSIRLVASYYNQDGKLIDVAQTWLSDTGIVAAGKEVNIAFDHSLGSTNDADKETYAKNMASSVKIDITDFEIIE